TLFTHHIFIFSLHFFFFYRTAPYPPPHSFPTRRSSDLYVSTCSTTKSTVYVASTLIPNAARIRSSVSNCCRHMSTHSLPALSPRSEEHTSELQSRFDLVCRLLLEKKKLNNRTTKLYIQH